MRKGEAPVQVGLDPGGATAVDRKPNSEIPMSRTEPRQPADVSETLENRGEIMRGILLWLIGIPIPIIILLWLFGVLH